MATLLSRSDARCGELGLTSEAWKLLDAVIDGSVAVDRSSLGRWRLDEWGWESLRADLLVYILATGS